MADLIPASNVFEKLKRVNEHGSEIWSARELARVLEYSEFRHFQPVIAKAREACEKSGHQIQDHFEEILDMVEIGSGAQRQVENWQLSMAAKDIHRRKGLQKKEGILDHMGSTELAANLFRATQTEEKLRREQATSKDQANRIHNEVGKKVHQTIRELGGTMPENLPVRRRVY